MTISIINLRTDALPPGGVYVGRANPRKALRRSPLANPFTLKQYTREEALAKYEEWLRWHLSFDGPERAELIRLIDLARIGDVYLACWCAPDSCHADIIRKYIEADLAGLSLFRVAT